MLSPGKLPVQQSLPSFSFLFLFSMPLGSPVLPQLWLLSPTVSLAKPVQEKEPPPALARETQILPSLSAACSAAGTEGCRGQMSRRGTFLSLIKSPLLGAGGCTSSLVLTRYSEHTEKMLFPQKAR